MACRLTRCSSESELVGACGKGGPGSITVPGVPGKPIEANAGGARARELVVDPNEARGASTVGDVTAHRAAGWLPR